MDRLYTKYEVELLLQFQALQKAQNTMDMLLNIGIMHLGGAVPANVGVAAQGKALLQEIEKVGAALLPHEEQIKSLVAEFMPKDGVNENQEIPN